MQSDTLEERDGNNKLNLFCLFNNYWNPLAKCSYSAALQTSTRSLLLQENESKAKGERNTEVCSQASIISRL